jgi:hypothetical protein
MSRKQQNLSQTKFTLVQSSWFGQYKIGECLTHPPTLSVDPWLLNLVFGWRSWTCHLASSNWPSVPKFGSLGMVDLCHLSNNPNGQTAYANWLKIWHKLTRVNFAPILWAVGGLAIIHKEEWARLIFGYKSESKLEFLKNPAMFWRPQEVSGFFMATFVYFSSKIPLYALFCWPGVKFRPKNHKTD